MLFFADSTIGRWQSSQLKSWALPATLSPPLSFSSWLSSLPATVISSRSGCTPSSVNPVSFWTRLSSDLSSHIPGSSKIPVPLNRMVKYLCHQGTLTATRSSASSKISSQYTVQQACSKFAWRCPNLSAAAASTVGGALPLTKVDGTQTLKFWSSWGSVGGLSDTATWSRLSKWSCPVLVVHDCRMVGANVPCPKVASSGWSPVWNQLRMSENMPGPSLGSSGTCVCVGWQLE